jgi:flagellar biosynthetic protein FliR
MADLFRQLESPPILALLQLLGLTFARLAPIIIFTPLFGGEITPKRYRVGLAILLTGILAATQASASPAPAETLHFAALLVKESVLGFTLAVIIKIVFESFTAVGALADLSRGASNAMLFNPMARQQSSVLGAFYMQLALVLFVSIGGHAMLIAALADSFTFVPAQSVMPADLVAAPTTDMLIQLVSGLFALALRLAAPVLIVVFILDLSLGLLNKVTPQVQVFFLSMALKPWIGLILVLLSLGLVASIATDQFTLMFAMMDDWLIGMK